MLKSKSVNFVSRVTEYNQNYVDRVRYSHITEENKKQIGFDYNCREKSASNLDLSISRKNTENKLSNNIRSSKSLDCNTQSNFKSDLTRKYKERNENLSYGKLFYFYNMHN